MTRFRLTYPDEMADETKRLIELIDSKMGITPNMIKEMAISPAILRSYYCFREALSKGKLSHRLQALIPILVSEVNANSYCLSAGTALARLAGFEEEEIEASRKAANKDRKVAVALEFARNVTLHRGRVDDSQIKALRSADFSDEEILEIIGHVVLSIFANYFTEISQTPIGFPRVKPTAVPETP